MTEDVLNDVASNQYTRKKKVVLFYQAKKYSYLSAISKNHNGIQMWNVMLFNRNILKRNVTVKFTFQNIKNKNVLKFRKLIFARVSSSSDHLPDFCRYKKIYLKFCETTQPQLPFPYVSTLTDLSDMKSLKTILKCFLFY